MMGQANQSESECFKRFNILNCAIEKLDLGDNIYHGYNLRSKVLDELACRVRVLEDN